ncbi:MAG: hypothetical protein NVS9B15_05580 [Acidobacteriaceae bacterium]
MIMRILAGALRLIAANLSRVLLLLVGIPVIALLWAGWLWIPEAHYWQLAVTIIVAIALLSGISWLQALVMRGLRSDSLRPDVAAIISVLIWFAILCILLRWIDARNNWLGNFAPYLYSKLSRSTRSELPLPRLAGMLADIQATCFWYIGPALLLPFALEWSSFGMVQARYRKCLQTIGTLCYWLWLAPVAVIAANIPDILVSKQFGTSLSAQTFSVILRVGLAYLILFACWILALAITARTLRDCDSLETQHVSGNPVPQPA